MKRAGFNIATYWYTDRALKVQLYIAFIIVSVAFSLFNYLDFSTISGEKDVLAVKMEGLRKDIEEIKKRPFAEENREVRLTAAEAPKRVEMVNRILRQDSFSWSELLYSLEKAAPDGISIKRIKPSYKDRKIRISGIAKGLESITRLMENLKESPYIKSSFLLRQDVEIPDKVHAVISFEIEAEGEF